MFIIYLNITQLLNVEKRSNGRMINDYTFISIEKSNTYNTRRKKKSFTTNNIRH